MVYQQNGLILPFPSKADLSRERSEVLYREECNLQVRHFVLLFSRRFQASYSDFILEAVQISCIGCGQQGSNLLEGLKGENRQEDTDHFRTFISSPMITQKQRWRSRDL